MKNEVEEDFGDICRRRHDQIIVNSANLNR